MDFVTIIGLIGSFFSIGDVSFSLFKRIKYFFKKKKINLNDWDLNDPVAQRKLDAFKEELHVTCKEHIFTDDEIDEITRKFFKVYSYISIGIEEKNQIEKTIKEILYSFNAYVKSLMSPGEKVLHSEMNSYYQDLMDELHKIQDKSERENIQRFLRAVEYSKTVELSSIDDLIYGEYEIDRTAFIETIDFNASRIVSIQGNAGSGKSVICKKLIADKEFVLATRAEKLACVNSLNDVWNFDIESSILWLGIRKVYIYIDAIEFVADCGNNAIFLLQQIYNLTEKYKNVYVITSCRSADNSAFMKIDTRYKVGVYVLPELSEREIDTIAQSYSIIKTLKDQKSYSDLLGSPFYINLIVSGGFSEESISDENSFRRLIWEKIICLKDKCRNYNFSQSDIKNAVENIVFTRARNFVVYVHDDIIDSDIQNALLSEDIIIKNESGIRLKYDVFEDICFEQYIDKQFDACAGTYSVFFEGLKEFERCIYRRYQIWIANKLLVKSSREKFIYSLVSDSDIPHEWKTQTEIGIVKSRYCNLFFDDFQELLAESVIKELVDITNLYAFEARISYVPVLSMTVKPIGTAREYFIKFSSELKIDKYVSRDAIIKLCDDYSNYSLKTTDVEEVTCKILIGYIEELLEKCKQEKAYIYSKEIVKLFLIVSRMARSSKQWLSDFVQCMIDEYCSETDISNRVSEDVLESIVKNIDPQFVLELPELTCKVAETLWKNDKHNKYSIYDDGIYDVKAYGLTDKASYLNNSDMGVVSIPFIWNLFSRNFIIGLNWAISFINNSIQCFYEKFPNDIQSVDIYFCDIDNKKSYLGNEQLWLSSSMEHMVPVVLTDIVYVIKSTIINTLNNSSDTEYVIKLADYVKNTIYNNSNNILLLSIIESIGMKFEKELPGYAIELASNIDLVIWDVHRYAHNLPNPTKEALEKQIQMTLSLPPIPGRYSKHLEPEMCLQQYVMKTYMVSDESLRKKINNIIDYLYSLYDEKKNSFEHLQIQKMDLRRVKVVRNDSGSISVEPVIHGEAEKIVQKNEESNRYANELMLFVNDLLSNIKNETAGTNELVASVNHLINEMQKNESIDIQFEKILIAFIFGMLSRKDLTKAQRGYLIVQWLNRVEKIFSNGVYLSEIPITSRLWEQLDEDVEYDVKEKILLVMLKSIMHSDNNGQISQLSSSIMGYLRSNVLFANRFFLTILNLAEDERNRQKYIEDRLMENGKEFKVSNFYYRFFNIDEFFKKNNIKPFDSKRNDIIKEYLVEGHEYNIVSFDVNNYDINVLCNIVNCGLSLSNREFSKIIKSVIQYIIEKFYEKQNSNERYEVIDTYKQWCISKFFIHELNETDIDATTIYDLLFNDVDCSKFTRASIELYQDIFGGFVSSYVFGYEENGRRFSIEKKINLLENYVNNISADRVRFELRKGLFLYPTRYNKWDVNKLNNKYNYSDKTFINTQIKKYGLDQLQDVLFTVYMLGLDCLMPEILLSLSECFQNTSSKNTGLLLISVQQMKTVVDMVILKAFLYYGDEIKKDEELISAYENILISLVEIRDEKAAVLLDEFRVH